MRIFHNSWENEYRSPFGAVTTGSVCRISVDVFDADSPEVYLRTWKDGFGESLAVMERDDSFGGEGERYSINVQMPDKGCLIWYYFVVKNNGETLYYGNNSDNTGGIGAEYQEQPPSYQITVYKESITPEWFKSGICYQIFPDRFARDDAWQERTEAAIAARNERIHEGSQKQFIEDDWSKPAYYIKDEDGNVTEWPFYGGSLKGIESKLKYLKSYGVSSIYLNPIFEAVSNHRYDTADYMKIDPILGSEDDFRSLCEEASRLGISIILDGVFSHTGADSVYFDKYGNYGGIGAYNNKESNYCYWYKFDEEEENGYKCWWGVRDLPEVKEDNAFYRQMIVGDNGVIKKWLRAGARGFRLDVADELPDSFIHYIRESLKAESTDNLLIGEVWEDASNKVSYDCKRKFLMGEELDSTMNYPFRQILLDYINYTISSSQAADRLMSLKENYPSENYYGALNVIGTHDRARILNEMAAQEDYDSAARKAKIMAALQYTLPGVPCIYYGDEVGMMGGKDPENRNAFPWDNMNMDMAYHYRMLGLIYDQHEVLKNGDVEFLSSKYDFIPDDVLAFARYNDNEQILVLINRSYGPTNVDLTGFGIPSESRVIELLESKYVDISGNIELERLSAKILLITHNLPTSEEKSRRAGIICHISSIPGGNLGEGAKTFVDWLSSIGIKVWQILPLNPTGMGDCPYNSKYAFAGNPDFIDKNNLPGMSEYLKFYEANKFWLDVYKNYECYNDDFIKDQYYFWKQWKDLKSYANSKGVKIMGDLPIFVSGDSADVDAFNENFQVDELGKLTANAGVPPDDFSEDGQNWGSALYDWDALKSSGYDWWIKRLRQCAERYDILRLDHFRGFSEYFSIPIGKTPSDGSWQHGPGYDFFRKAMSSLKQDGYDLEIIAEDLGLLDAGVFNLLKLTGFPGMNIWQFSAEEMMNMDTETAEGRVFYTGTHDNQTLVGWLKSTYPDKNDKDIYIDALEIMRKLFLSPAQLTMLQLQDVLLLDDKARMNVPGIAEGNWKWKINADSIPSEYHDIFYQMSEWMYRLIKESER